MDAVTAPSQHDPVGDPYARLGVRPVVNAAATLTPLGGSIMPAPVVEAMVQASRTFVDLVELHERVGDRLARLTGNEAGYVSCGAAAGITHAVAACIAGTDPHLRDAFPYLDGVTRREVVIERRHRNGFDYAARVTGARLVEVDGSRDDLRRALSERTACVLTFAGTRYGTGIDEVAAVVEVASGAGVPVLVDAAAQIPPLSTLWTYTREAGADAVICSGGKGLRGPQASGLVLGTRTIIEGCRANGSPNSSIGRTMKVGKEELIGLLAAVEWYLAQDEEVMIAGYEAMVQAWVDQLGDLQGVTVTRGYPSEAGQPHGRALLRFSSDSLRTRDAVVAALWEGDPRVAVGKIGDDTIALNPQTVAPGEEQLVIERLRSALQG